MSEENNGPGTAAKASRFYYVYFLTDIATGTRHYVGMTSLKPAECLDIAFLKTSCLRLVKKKFVH